MQLLGTALLLACWYVVIPTLETFFVAQGSSKICKIKLFWRYQSYFYVTNCGISKCLSETILLSSGLVYAPKQTQRISESEIVRHPSIKEIFSRLDVATWLAGVRKTDIEVWFISALVGKNRRPRSKRNFNSTRRSEKSVRGVSATNWCQSNC